MLRVEIGGLEISQVVLFVVSGDLLESLGIKSETGLGPQIPIHVEIDVDDIASLRDEEAVALVLLV